MCRPRSVGRPWCATRAADAWGTVACNLDPRPSLSSPHPPHLFARDLHCTRCASACLRISARHVAFFELLRVSTRGEARHPGPVAVVTCTLTRLTRRALALLGTATSHCTRHTTHDAAQRLRPPCTTSTRSSHYHASSTRDLERISRHASHDALRTLHRLHLYTHSTLRRAHVSRSRALSHLIQRDDGLSATTLTSLQIISSDAGLNTAVGLSRRHQRSCTLWWRAYLALRCQVHIRRLREKRQRTPRGFHALHAALHARAAAARSARASAAPASPTPPPHAAPSPRRPITRTPIAHFVGKRLRDLKCKWIAWVSGEAYNPGPAPSHIPRGQAIAQPVARPARHTQQRRTHATSDYARYVNDVRYRFHNTQGLRDHVFRPFYLKQARTSCEVLALAETNCESEEEGRVWARDWLGSSGSFWAPAPPRDPSDPNSPGRRCRGMAILFAASLGDVQATCVWRDPEGRGIAVRAYIHKRPTLLIAFHADCADDVSQAASYRRLRDAVPAMPGHDVVWLVDANNVRDLRRDAKTSWGGRVTRTHTGGVREMLSCATAWGGLRDAYRVREPDGEAYTHRQTSKKQKRNASGQHSDDDSDGD